MEILVCIDDTDNLESPGTGHLAEILRHDLEELYGAKTERITRHQLYVCDEIPYTSHNSAMCFRARINPQTLDEITRYSQDLLVKNSAEGSDPGLCVAVADRIKNREELIRFGLDATKKVLCKRDAVSLAERMNVHLSEHGGTGGGIIGALAGVGLRISGNNGRFKGWIKIDESQRNMQVDMLCSKFDINEVRSVDGARIPGEGVVILQDKVKTVLIDGKSVLLVKEVNPGVWVNIEKEELRKY
ncbi:MAG TPA: hypothetical protein PK514_15410 [Spirochaetota bacterium]|nr:hypothetical protein [Spirochaetota bacterium]